MRNDDGGGPRPRSAESAFAPLVGFTVAVTAARRRHELAALLERRGARAILAPALRIVPLPDDQELLTATCACIDDPPDVVVGTTGIGFRGWMEAADGWGLGEQLRQRLAAARLLARGPKVRGAMKAAGLVEAWSPRSESSAEVLGYLLQEPLVGRRVAVQLHGQPLPDFVEALRAAGATVVEVPVYRWVPPQDEEPVRRLVRSIPAGAVDAVTFTSAPAAANLLRTARTEGVLAPMLEALRGDVLAACVGPVTAEPLVRAGVPVVQPARGRIGDLVRTVVEALPGRSRPGLLVGGRRLELRGHAVVVDNVPVALPPTQLAVLRALARVPGQVLSRAELLSVIPAGEQAREHAVETSVARLRQALGDPGLITTVVKRGYRLGLRPEEPPNGAPSPAVRDPGNAGHAPK